MFPCENDLIRQVITTPVSSYVIVYILDLTKFYAATLYKYNFVMHSPGICLIDAAII